MVSVASGGTTDRIAARILFKVLRAGSGTPARYSSKFFGAPLAFAAELRLPEFSFFTRAMLQELPLQVHAPDNRAAVRRENGPPTGGVGRKPEPGGWAAARVLPQHTGGWTTCSL